MASIPTTRLQGLIEQARALPALRTAVVHPCDARSLEGALEAAHAKLIEPVLVGPRARIEAAARDAGISLEGLELVEAAHSHDAARIACGLARAGRVAALMKGALHSGELLGAMLDRAAGLRTDRRMSHVFVLDVADFPRLLLLTDAAINIAPDLDAKRDIVQNAIDCALALGIGGPRVAVLAAVETVHPAMPATVDAAALAKMAERGQIVGARVDGPLAFDNAVSPEAAAAKRIDSCVAGHADVLVVPNIEAGNIAAKQLTWLASAQTAGIVLGARVPVVLTSRADASASRLAACAVAAMVARHERLKPRLRA